MSPWTVPRGERRLTAALAGYFFLLMAALYLMKPARNALFLEDLGADKLPYVYLATAFVTWWVVAAYVRVTTIASLQRIIRVTLAATLVSLLGFWIWMSYDTTAAVVVFYVWVKVYAVLLPSQFWLLAEELLDPRQARRLFGPIGAGGVLGGIVGSALAAAVARLLGTQLLLLCACAAVVGAWALLRLVLARFSSPRAHAQRERGSSAGGAMSGPKKATGSDEPRPAAGPDRALVFTIASILLVATTAHTMIDWQFNKAAESIATADARAAFFGGFFTVLNVVTLLIQLLATSFVLRYFGIGMAMALLPVAVTLGAVGILLYPRLWMVSLARGADDALRLSVDQSGRELLFLPFSSADRQRLKPRIDLITTRVANGLAGIVILAAIWLLDDPLRAASVVVLLLAGLWAGLVVHGRRQYANALQHILSVRDLDVRSLARSRLDANASSAIRQGLASDDTDTIEAALALAEHTDPRAFVDEMRALLRATEDIALRGRVLRLLADIDDEPTGAVSEALAGLDRDDGTSVAEAIAYACATRDAEARERVFEHLESSEVMLDKAGLRPTLTALLHDDDPHVVGGALAACARFPDAGLVLEICAAGSRRSVEPEALQTLQSLGHEAIGGLTGILAHPRNSRPLRRFAARALGRIGGRDAAAGLIAGLVADDRKVRRSTLKALNYMRRRREDLDIGREREAAAIAIEWRDYLSLHRVAAVLGEPGTHSPTAFVATVVHERLRDAEEQLFRALGLRHPIQAVFFAYRGLITGDPAARSHAIELIDSVIETPERRTLVRLLENTDREERGRIAAHELSRPLPPNSAVALRELMDPGDPWLAACAIRALDQPSLVPDGLRRELLAHDYAPLDEVLKSA